MSLWKKLTGELVDIIEWLDSTRDTLVWRFERYQNEIKNGARLIVREGQAAVFVNQGQIADVFAFAGTYTLRTENLPILSTLQGWKHGFNSPFKAEVYFVNLRQFTSCKWGTMNPVMLRDAEFGPIRLRAFGTYAFRVSSPTDFLRQIVGTHHRFTAEGITDQLRNFIVSRFTEIVAESKIPALDLAANYQELANFVSDRLRPSFAEYGLELTTFLVENISLPPEVEKVLDQRTSMGIASSGSGGMNAYTQFQAAQALGQPGSAAGGTIGASMGLGAGVVMGQQMAQALAQPAAHPATPPPAPAAGFHVALDGRQAGPFDLQALNQMVSSGRVTPGSMVWKAGMPAWAPASSVGELAGLFANVPPPLPPA
ncbi:MAG: SPFH domain-containing protein [Phycisphaeraceae bacterium]|nr:MAG: SPFH domain-containing protein [Phycisphaeraceae bacterium]